MIMRHWPGYREQEARQYLQDHAPDLAERMLVVRRLRSWQGQVYQAGALSLTPKFLQQLRTEVGATCLPCVQAHAKQKYD